MLLAVHCSVQGAHVLQVNMWKADLGYIVVGNET